jgi:hypothetical protein
MSQKEWFSPMTLCVGGIHCTSSPIVYYEKAVYTIFDINFETIHIVKLKFDFNIKYSIIVTIE